MNDPMGDELLAELTYEQWLRLSPPDHVARLRGVVQAGAQQTKPAPAAPLRAVSVWRGGPLVETRPAASLAPASRRLTDDEAAALLEDIALWWLWQAAGEAADVNAYLERLGQPPL